MIIAVDGRRITTAPELQVEMLTKQPGQTVLLDQPRFRKELHEPVFWEVSSP